RELSVLCDRCGSRPASVFQAVSGLRLCSECFVEDIRVRVRFEVERWGMVEAGDVILLALSGGKDSYTLLESMALNFKASRLIGLSIIEGIPGYNREDDVRFLIETARGYGVDIHVVRVSDYVGLSVYDMAMRARSCGLNVSACTFCGISRRRIMHDYAEQLGASKLATAHNLDDEVQTLIINFLRGDIVGLLKLHPLSYTREDRVRRIKPLRKIYEWETATYAMIRGFHLQSTECMFINENPTLRARIRFEIYDLERKMPGILLRMLELIDNLLVDEARKVSKIKLNRCSKCGALTSTSRSICKLCELLEEISFTTPLYRLKNRFQLISPS
ncbi:MAG: TIGR00269 family protein, partial [Acidilobaceae archaeon]